MNRSLRNSSAWSGQAEAGAGPSRYLTPVLVDSLLAFGPGRSGCPSVLLLPAGAGLVLDQLLGAVAGHSTGRGLLLGAHGVTYPCDEQKGPLRVVRPDELSAALTGCEAGDYLLLVEPRHWPITGYDFAAVIEQSRRCTGGTYAIAVGRGESGARERVEWDAAGRVRRVQRIYSQAGWSGAGTVICAVVPARAILGVTFASLDDLRSQLAAKGLLTRDLPVETDAADLTEPAGLLTMAEQWIEQALADPPADLTAVRPEVLSGRACRIASSARLIGPVVVHERASIEAGATVVGPALVGPGARIGAGAVVARSVVLTGAQVAPGMNLCNEIVWGDASAGVGQAPPEGCTSVRATDSCVSRHQVVADLPRKQRSFRRRAQGAIKRAADATLAGMALLALSPVLAVVALLVKATSRGPVFFIHQREGRDGREFGCLKFRTMAADAHKKQREMYGQNQVDGPQFKIEKDPRVTPIGRILRGTNIDELPQLFNVLVGQMSLVGPRPSPFRENQICVAWRRARLSVRPGITGVWQICRDRSGGDADFHQWIFYDLAYVKHFSLWLDLKIVFWTVASGVGRWRVPLERLVPDSAAHEQGQDPVPAARGGGNGTAGKGLNKGNGP